MANVNLGRLALGEQENRNGTLQRDGLGIRTDTYTFDTGSTTANVAIEATSFSNNIVALVLFKDNNSDRIINAGDRVELNAGNGGFFQSVNSRLVRGDYIARITSSANTDYNIRLSRGTTGGANPLAGKEIELGTISQDLQRSNRISDKDTADNFAFTLNGNSSLDINVRELGNKKGDVNIRIVQDLNGNGEVDENEVVVKGISTLKGNVDTITGLKDAGDYILQVCQTNGNTRFGVKFDHSVA